MEQGHDGIGAQWDWDPMGLGHNGTWKRQDWHKMGSRHDRTGALWDWDTTGLGHNGIRTRRDWDTKRVHLRYKHTSCWQAVQAELITFNPPVDASVKRVPIIMTVCPLW